MKFKLPVLFDYVFPNMILPNALFKEQGLVEFVRSRYSHQVDENCIMQQSFGTSEQTLANKMFSGELGNYPNSLSSTHLRAPLYTNTIYDLEENSLFYGRSVFNKYLYPINLTPHIDVFCGVTDSGHKLDGEYFWKHMSSLALNDVRNGRAIILLDYAEENFIGKSTFEALHKSLQNSKIPKENIILGLNSFNAQEVYESMFDPDERRLEVRNWPFVMANTSYEYYSNPNRCVNEQEFKDSKNTIRKNHFIFKVRRPRDHRLVLLSKFASDGLLEKADWSCLTPVRDIYQIKNILSEYQMSVELDKVNETLKQTPHRLQSEEGANYDVVSAWTDRDPTAYRNSYLYVCTETYTHEGYTSLTEKVFKPIANYQPFVFMAYPGALKMLRSLGFKTFSPFIDESYDDEPDRSKRLEMLYAEITRLCNMPIEDLHNWYWSMEEILIHNKNHFMNIWENEPFTLKFINYLNERCSL